LLLLPSLLPCSDWTPSSTDCSSCTCQQTCRTCT
jgi:hypothetical protein